MNYIICLAQDIHTRLVGQLLYQLHPDKVQHFGARSPTKDDANSRYDDKLLGFGVGLGLTLDQKSPGSIPGGATNCGEE